MIVKLSIFLCSLCVVKAFVAVNIFDDDVNETQRSSLSDGMEGSPKISDCSPLGCVQLCRRLGLKGGVCVNGKCKCDWTHYKETGDVDETQRSSLSDDMAGSPKISDCSPLGCVQLCRRLGLKGGVCVNGKCKCDWHKELGDGDIQTSPLVEMEKSSMISECSPLGCAQLCRRIGLKGGVCVHGMCKCDLFIELEGDTPRSLTMCDWSSCDRGCRSIGYPGGSCMGSECRCNPRPVKFEVTNRIDGTDGEVRVINLEKPAPIISDCNPSFCDQQCRRMFFKGGVCVNGQCKCDIIIDSEENNEIPATEEENKLYKDFMTGIKKKSSIGICNVFDCNNMCRRIGFIGGRCDSIKYTCQCF